MIKSKTKNLLALALALAVFSTASFGISAKSQNVNEKKGVVITINKAASIKTPKSNVKAAKPQIKNGINNQLTQLERKLDVIASDTNKLAVGIDTFIKLNTTGSAIITTGSAITTTESAITTSGSAIDTTSGSAVTTTDSAISTTSGAITTTGSAIVITKTAFINSTSGKLKALSNRLSAVEKSIKLLDKKLDKNSNEQYKSLVIKLTTVKTKITLEMDLLKALKISK